MHDTQWLQIRQIYRCEVARVLRDISNGQVDSLDLAKLHNFCMASVRLQHKVTSRVWDIAKREAEIGGLLHNAVEDFNDDDDEGERLT